MATATYGLIPSGGVWGYEETDDPLVDSATHADTVSTVEQEALDEKVDKGQFLDRLGVGRLRSTSGSPVENSVNNMAVWQLNDTGTASVGATVAIPLDVDIVDVELMWTQGTTGAGNAVLSLNAREYDAGSDLTATSTSWFSTGVVANGTAHLVEVTRLATGKTVTPGKYLDLRLSRSGSSGADTLSGNVHVLALIVRSPYTGPGAVIIPSEYTELT